MWLRKLNPEQDGIGGEPAASPDDGAAQLQNDGGAQASSAPSFTPFELFDSESNAAFPVNSPDDLLSFIDKQSESRSAAFAQQLEQLKIENAANSQVIAELRAAGLAGHPQGQPTNGAGDDFDIEIPDDFDPLNPESVKETLKRSLRAMAGRLGGQTTSVRQLVQQEIENMQRAQNVESARLTLLSEFRKANPSVNSSDEQILSFANKLVSDPALLGRMVAQQFQQSTRSSATSKLQVRPLSANGSPASQGAGGSNPSGLGPGSSPNDVAAAQSEWGKMVNTPGYADNLMRSNPALFEKVTAIAVEKGW